MSSHRGSYRGFDKGRARGSWRGSASLSRAENLPPPKPFGPTIGSINVKTLLKEEDAPTIKGSEYIASYNWISGRSPVIPVPGQPLSLQ